jgi:hypothetical protein
LTPETPGTANVTASGTTPPNALGERENSKMILCGTKYLTPRKKDKMEEAQIKKLLNDLADYRAGRDAINLQKQAIIDTILTDEIKKQIADIEAEFAEKSVTVNEKIAEAEAAVKTAILEHGASVKSDFLHAVWVKGRISWDTKSLDGYAVAHPELLGFRKEGEPSVTIRTV